MFCHLVSISAQTTCSDQVLSFFRPGAHPGLPIQTVQPSLLVWPIQTKCFACSGCSCIFYLFGPGDRYVRLVLPCSACSDQVLNLFSLFDLFGLFNLFRLGATSLRVVLPIRPVRPIRLILPNYLFFPVRPVQNRTRCSAFWGCSSLFGPIRPGVRPIRPVHNSCSAY